MGSVASRAQALAVDLKLPLNICCLTNVAVFLLHAGPNKSDRFYDATGSCTYLLSVVLSLLHTRPGSLRDPRSLAASAAVLTWAVRLGTFLFQRISRDGHDRRLDRIKKSFVLFAGAWGMQISWCFLVAMPVYLLHQYSCPSGEEGQCKPLTAIDALGFGMWALGFWLEVVADGQKKRFAEAGLRQSEGFIRTGLWSISRHPNYLGEILLWSGLSIVAYNGVKDNPDCPLPAAALTAPATTCFLLLCLSGIPMLEKRANYKWGNDPRYREYVANTPILVPSVLSLVGMLRTKQS